MTLYATAATTGTIAALLVLVVVAAEPVFEFVVVGKINRKPTAN